MNAILKECQMIHNWAYTHWQKLADKITDEN